MVSSYTASSPMPPTAQEMASELHAWRCAAARSRSTVKDGSAVAWGRQSLAVTARGQAAEHLETPEMVKWQGWPGRRSQRDPMAARDWEGSRPPLCLAVSPSAEVSFALLDRA